MRAAGKIMVGMLLLPGAAALGYLYTPAKPDTSRFYIDDDLPADGWQIPIIEPYRLITAGGSTKTAVGYSRWNFQDGGLPSFQPDSINYEKGFITYHEAAGSYGFFDTSRKTVSRLKDFSRFLLAADSLGVSGELYSVEAVYSCWQQTRQLPWAKEIFAQNGAATTLK